jgi:hypothetical protein
MAGKCLLQQITLRPDKISLSIQRRSNSEGGALVAQSILEGISFSFLVKICLYSYFSELIVIALAMFF